MQKRSRPIRKTCRSFALTLAGPSLQVPADVVVSFVSLVTDGNNLPLLKGDNGSSGGGPRLLHLNYVASLPRVGHPCNPLEHLHHSFARYQFCLVLVRQDVSGPRFVLLLQDVCGSVDVTLDIEDIEIPQNGNSGN